MADNILRQLAELERLDSDQLKERWRALFGGVPPAYNRMFLIKRLAHRVQELAYGGLSMETRKRMDELLDAEGFDENGALPKTRSTLKKSPDKPVAELGSSARWTACGTRC